jgi:hypothetical protein
VVDIVYFLRMCASSPVAPFTILISDEEVVNNKEDNTDNDAKDTANDNNGNDDTTDNNNKATMPPKVKPVAAWKPTVKKPTGMNKDELVPPPPAAKLLTISTNLFVERLSPSRLPTTPTARTTTPTWQPA